MPRQPSRGLRASALAWAVGDLEADWTRLSPLSILRCVSSRGVRGEETGERETAAAGPPPSPSPSSRREEDDEQPMGPTNG